MVILGICPLVWAPFLWVPCSAERAEHAEIRLWPTVETATPGLQQKRSQNVLFRG